MFRLSKRYTVIIIAVFIFVLSNHLFAKMQKIDEPIIVVGHYKYLYDFSNEDKQYLVRVYYIVNKKDPLQLTNLLLGDSIQLSSYDMNWTLTSDHDQVFNVQDTNYYGLRYAEFELNNEELQEIMDHPEILEKAVYQFSDGTEKIAPFDMEVITQNLTPELQVISSGSSSGGDGEIEIHINSQITLKDIDHPKGLTNFTISLNGESVSLPLKSDLILQPKDRLRIHYESLTLLSSLEHPIVKLGYMNREDEKKYFDIWQEAATGLPFSNLNDYVKEKAGGRK